MTEPTVTTDVDGVPVLIAPTAGPMRAGLMFRVGRADETLSTSGITHLVEHLALHRHGATAYHYNGMTSSTTTQFVISGTSEEVTSFINDVCASLRDLPLPRLEAEKKILATEAAGRPTPADHSMALWRYGARDFGLASYPEWGIHTITADLIADWATARFSRANAVLWIAGSEIPPGLRLDLPDGAAYPLPAESSALPVLPAYFRESSAAILLDAKVPRTRAAVMYTRALDRALFRELRHGTGLSYTAAAAYNTDGRPQAVLTAAADGRPDQLHRVLDSFVNELWTLERNDIDQAELATIRSMERAGLADPDVEARLLPRRATDTLSGFAWPATEEMDHGFEKVTAADIRGVAALVHQSALLMVPGELTPPTGFEEAPQLSRYNVTGKRYRSRADDEVALVLGADGVTLATADGPRTVLFHDCAAMLRWPDGARQLIGNDGIGVRIEPNISTIPVPALAQLDGAVSAAAIIDLPARDPASVPRRPRAFAARRLSWVRRTRALRVKYRLFRVHRNGITSPGWTSLLVLMTVAASLLTLTKPRMSIVALVCAAILLRRRYLRGHW